MGLETAAMTGARKMAGEHRLRVAALALFALLIQALTPAAAMAGPQGEGSLVICAASGTATVTASLTGGERHEGRRGFAGMPCADCVAAAMAAVPAPGLTVQPVAYVGTKVEHGEDRAVMAPRARAPPRRLGQGPPTA
jgi:hypothetical protein